MRGWCAHWDGTRVGTPLLAPPPARLSPRVSDPLDALRFGQIRIEHDRFSGKSVVCLIGSCMVEEHREVKVGALRFDLVKIVIWQFAHSR